ncbi:MAG TPA: hypothetical protein VH701_09645, partial [Vicinamibacterales bacterium]
VRGETEWLQYFATIALSIQLTIIGLCFTGPAFNTQLGILFWTVTAALLGAAEVWHAHEDESLSKIECCSGMDEPVRVEA